MLFVTFTCETPRLGEYFYYKKQEKYLDCVCFGKAFSLDFLLEMVFCDRWEVWNAFLNSTSPKTEEVRVH